MHSDRCVRVRRVETGDCPTFVIVGLLSAVYPVSLWSRIYGGFSINLFVGSGPDPVS